MTSPTKAAELPKPGDTLGNKYAIVRVLGEGGMGVVYEANHLRLRRRVAIKMLRPEVLDAPNILERFEREGRAASLFRSTHVAKVVDVDTSDSGIPYMVMEYLDGRDLHMELEARGALPIAEAVSYVLQACDAMKEAHANGVVHRDLKPSNLFLCREASGNVVKVLDFGISKAVHEARLTATFAHVGTPFYMSPEQLRSAAKVDARTDIWSLGVVLFELVTGHTPFQGNTLMVGAAILNDPPRVMRDLRPDAPALLEEIVRRSLEKDPNHRYPDVASFAAALAPLAHP